MSYRFAFPAAVMSFVLNQGVRGDISVSEGKWDGDTRPQAPCYFLENDRLRVTVLRQGAHIISVVDKRSGSDFINCMKANRSNLHGIYDRIDEDGRHLSDIESPKHFASMDYSMKRVDPGRFRFTAESAAMRVVRTLTLHESRPKLRVDVTYTRLSDDVAQMGIYLLTQLNLNRAPVSYNQVVVMPDEAGVFKNVTEPRGHYGTTIKSGWWFGADRESKKSVVMTYPTDGSVESIYLYRTPNWIHFLPFGPSKLVKGGDELSLWHEYLFLGELEDAGSLVPGDVSVTADEFRRMKDALIQELNTAPVLPGQAREVSLLPVKAEARIGLPPGGKPDASVFVVRNAIYDHPEKLDAQTWVSMDGALQAIAETRTLPGDLLVISGASSNGFSDELDLIKKAAELSGLPVCYGLNRADTNQQAYFEKNLGPKNWSRRVKDVTLISFAPGEVAWLEQAITEAAGTRIVVIGEEVPTALVAKSKVNLAMLPLPASMPSFERIGNWPVLSLPRVQSYPAFAVIHIFQDYLDVVVKPLGDTFGPHLFLDREGKSPPMGIPSFAQGRPLLTVAHITDTQLHIPSRFNTKEGKPLDQENMKTAVAEINELGVDFAVNTGDLVNVGNNEEQWKLYLELKDPLKVALYEVLGNHDWDETTPEGRMITTHYKLYCDDPLIYDFEKNGIFFMAFGTAVSKGEDLRQRLSKARKAKCTVLLYHDPITKSKGYGWWHPDLVDAANELNPTLAMVGHTHYLQWHAKQGMNEFVGPGLAWTKTSDQTWNGYFIHTFFEDKVVSSFKRLGCDDLFLTVVTPYRVKE
ncbi:MAG: metallophosphoesterase [Planctomycetota bacterium]|nr:metallophosphoesterase [Planctomycetota bacterium]